MQIVYQYLKTLLWPKQSVFCLYLLLGFALVPPVAYAQQNQAVAESADPELNSSPKDWTPHPWSIQVGYTYGSTANFMPQRIIRARPNQIYSQLLSMHGPTVDVGIMQINRFVWEYFECYPKLGVAIKYHRLKNKGSLGGLWLYAAPRYDYQALCELTPRLSLGLFYANVPSTNFPKKRKKDDSKSDEEEEEEQEQEEDNNKQYDPHISAVRPALALGTTFHIRFTRHWEMYHSLDYVYLLDIKKKKDMLGKVGKEFKFITYTAGIEYTFQPSNIQYPRKKKKGRSELGLIGSAKKPERKHDEAGLYFSLVGIYGLYSAPIAGGSALTLGNEWLLDWATKKDLEDKVKQGFLKISLLAGHRFLVGVLSLDQQIGFYLMNNMVNYGNVLEAMFIRLSASFVVFKHLSLGANLNILFTTLKEDKEKEERVAEGPNDEFIGLKIGYVL